MWWAVVAGMLISRRWIVLGFQARAGVEVRASSWEKASRLQGRGHVQAPDMVLREALQGEVVEPGVFCAADAVPWQWARSRWRTLRSAS